MGKQKQRPADDLERREAAVAAREAALAKRTETADAILEAADERDAVADARDVAADQRERDLDLAELLAPPEKVGYGDHWPERRNAALDRAQSKDDRTASHEDRDALTEGTGERETEACTSHRRETRSGAQARGRCDRPWQDVGSALGRSLNW